MYTKEDLNQYDFFNGKEIEYILDPLTGVLTRNVFIDYVNSLIEKNITFSLAMMDIDNFKLVNDNYGHPVGDECLVKFATELSDYLNGKGLVGRFGGDEFMFVFFGDGTYDSAYQMTSEIYRDANIIRKTYCLSSAHLFITSTCGCASFPKDGKNFDEIFLKVDKALYRGKVKGRNCYIVYVHEIHKDINVEMKEKSTIYKLYLSADKVFDLDLSYEEKIKYLCNLALKTNDMTDCIIIDDNNIEYSSNTTNQLTKKDIKDIEYFFGSDSVILPKNLKEYKDRSNYFNESLERTNVQSLCGIRIKKGNAKYGYIFFHENVISRIWQDKDISFALYLAKIVSGLK